jgi:hypothetical protein
MENGLILAIAIAAAIAIAVWRYYAKQRRRAELASIASRLGMSYSAEDMSGCLGYPFALLRRGDGRGTENVLSGTWEGLDVVEFDYWYYTESTDSKGHRTKSYSHFSCAVAGVVASLSAVSIGRENLFTRLADAVGLDDIAFETEEFNRAFNVKSNDRRCASDLIDQRMMAWLLTAPSDLAFEVSGRWLLCYGKRRAPADLIALLGTLKGFHEQIPRVVYDLYPPPQAAAPAADPDVPPRPDGRP